MPKENKAAQLRKSVSQATATAEPVGIPKMPDTGETLARIEERVRAQIKAQYQSPSDLDAGGEPLLVAFQSFDGIFHEALQAVSLHRDLEP